MAGMPSPYPSVFAFPETFDPEIAHPELVPPQAILGFHDFSTNSLTLVSDTGLGYEGLGPSLWYERNVTLVPETWHECECRILRLPRGVTSADEALIEHQRQ